MVTLLSRRCPFAGHASSSLRWGRLCMASSPAVSQFHNLDIITANLCLATFGLGWFMVNYLAFTSEVSAKTVSTAAGLLGGTGSLAGAGFMLLVGNVVEANQSFNLAFLMAGLMPLVASWAFASAPGREKGDVQPMAGSLDRRLNANDKFRGAVIGCGNIAQFHLRGWQRIPEVEIVGLVDPVRPQAEDRRPLRAAGVSV